jgi:exopolysaccharide biosynthesis polyprenyl glycosylphosphotransferase
MDKSKEKTLVLFSFIGDFVMVFFGLVFGHWLRFRSGLIPFDDSWWTSGGARAYSPIDGYLGLILFGSILLSITYLGMGLYQPKNILSFRAVAFTVIRSVAMWMMLYLGLSLVLRFDPPISRIYAISSGFAAMLFTLVWRYIYMRAVRMTGAYNCLIRKIGFLGWSNSASRLAKVILSDHKSGYSIVGFIADARSEVCPPPPKEVALIGHLSELAEVLRAEKIDVLVRVDAPVDVDELIAMSNLCDREMVQFKMIPSRLHSMISGLHIDTISDVPVLGVAEGPLEHILNSLLKRSVDIVGSSFGLFVSIPMICLFGTLVYLESPGPILYRQRRTGRRGKVFDIIKIRSMRVDAEAQGGAQWAKKGDSRRLKIGAFMRETNIDEIPQFWNVLRGDMSLVGPRPERPELISRFKNEIPHYNARHTVKPGITGWAQINGLRGDTDLTERVRYDLYYIEKWSLTWDFIIMIRTVFNKKNAY